MVNKAILIGNIGKDPEVKIFESGTKAVRFSLATNRNFQKDGEWQSETQWHNIVAWRNQADIAEKMTKGMKVYIEGEIRYRDWKKENGDKSRITDIHVSTLRRLSKREHSPMMPGEDQQPPTHSPAPQSADTAETTTNEDMPFG